MAALCILDMIPTVFETSLIDESSVLSKST